MITHEELMNMWEEDAGIDKTRLDDEAVSIPNLHHKYLRMLLDIKAKKIAQTHKLEELRKDKEMYYSGQATSDAYKDKPFDTRLKTKGAIARHVETDPEVIKLLQRIEYVDILVEGLNHILTQIQWRNSSIKSALDWQKFQSGTL